MFKYKIGVDCPICGETIIREGYIADYEADEDGSDLVVTLDMFSCETFVCESCGTVVITPDVDSMCEYEEHDNYDNDDYDDEEE